jgi:MarR family transcriptional regulator for hemolysin
MDEAPSTHSLGSLLSKTKWLLDAHFNRLLKGAGVEITPEQWSVLIVVHGNPGVSPSEIARRGYKDKTNVTRILDVLEGRGLLERRPDAADRRAFRIHLTSQGKRLMPRLFPIAGAVNGAALAGLSTTEQERLLDLLEKVKANLEAAP